MALFSHMQKAGFLMMGGKSFIFCMCKVMYCNATFICLNVFDQKPLKYKVEKRKSCLINPKT